MEVTERWTAAYDVSLDTRRTAVARRLERLGLRVQYSVFDLELRRGEADVVLDQVGALLAPTDAFLLVRRCQRCVVAEQTRRTRPSWVVG